MVTHLMTMTHKDIAPHTAADDDAHAAKDSAMAVAATATQTQDRTMVETLGEAVETLAATAEAVVEVTLEEQECDKPTRVRPNPSPPSTT
jgi:hypothetical protein